MAVEYVVVSDPGGDPWEEAVCASRAQAEVELERILDRIGAQGLERAAWRPLLRIEPRKAVLSDLDKPR